MYGFLRRDESWCMSPVLVVLVWNLWNFGPLSTKLAKFLIFTQFFLNLEKKKSNSLFQIFGNPRYERFVHTEIVNPSPPPPHTHTRLLRSHECSNINRIGSTHDYLWKFSSVRNVKPEQKIQLITVAAEVRKWPMYCTWHKIGVHI